MTLYVFTNGLVMHNTIYNEDFLKSTVMSDEIRTAVVEEVSLEIKEYMISQASVDPSQLSAADIDEDLPTVKSLKQFIYKLQSRLHCRLL